jgi:AhpD family alkylhydroperoxidase
VEVIDYKGLAPGLYEAMLALQQQIDSSGADKALLELVKLRASQINGCSFCVNMHANAARAAGVDDRRLHMVAAWRHSNTFTEPERAALRWSEELTRLSDGSPSPDALAELREHFGDEHVVALTWAVAAINSWNRMAVSLGQRGGPPAPNLTA